MCGFAGVIDQRRRAEEAEPWLRAAAELLRERGPDAEGRYVADPLAICARRLRIHDLSPRADQPFWSDDGKQFVCFNGAIFNYKTIRDQLRQCGIRFRTNSDTEVLLAALRQWDIDALPKFDGMFAFCWYDTQSQRAVLARDRLGIKPLQFYKGGDFLIFGSEIKALLLDSRVPRKVNADVIPEYFAFQTVIPPATMFEGIEQLQPGSFLDVDCAHGLNVRRGYYWQADASLISDPAAPDLEDALRSSLEQCWHADKAVSIQLSGGIDSSLLAALSSELDSGQPIRAYSVVFDDQGIRYAPRRSEEEYIRYVSERLNARTTYSRFSKARIRNALPEAVWRNDVPLYSANSILYLLHAEDIRREATVLLTGEGSDDLFLGYSEGVQINQAVDVLETTYVKFDVLSKLFGADARDWALASRLAILNRSRLAGMTELQKASVLTLESVLHGLLARQDRMFMARSIEGRPPYCGVDVVRARFALPDSLVHDGTHGKLAVRKIAAKYFPEWFLYRKKGWLAGPVSDWCADPEVWGGYVSSISMDRLSAYFDISYLRKVLELPDSQEKWSGGNLALIVAAMNFDLWLAAYIDGDGFRSPERWSSSVPEAQPVV